MLERPMIRREQRCWGQRVTARGFKDTEQSQRLGQPTLKIPWVRLTFAADPLAGAEDPDGAGLLAPLALEPPAKAEEAALGMDTEKPTVAHSYQEG